MSSNLTNQLSMTYHISNLSHIKNTFSKTIIFKNCKIWHLRASEALTRCSDWLAFFGDDVGLTAWCCFSIGCSEVVGGVWATVGGPVLVRNGTKACQGKTGTALLELTAEEKR